LLNTVLGSLSSGVAASTSSYESIASATPSGTNTVTFNSIPSTYKHLQLRSSTLSASSGDTLYINFNSDTGNNYTYHRLSGNGSAASANGYNVESGCRLAGLVNGTSATYPTVVISDIIDYADTSKYKTVRTFSGVDVNGSGGEIDLVSNLWKSTSAISSITISGSFNFTGTFSLYGIKGA
jgi:hypothetical protein